MEEYGDTDYLPDELYQFLFGSDLFSLDRLWNGTSNKRDVLEKITRIPALYERTVKLRRWRELQILDGIRIDELAKEELGVVWPHSPPIPLPTEYNPYSLPEYGINIHAADALTLTNDIEFYIHDLLVTMETDHSEELQRTLWSFEETLGDLSNLTQIEKDYKNNKSKYIRRLQDYADDRLKEHVFYELDRDFVNMEFLKDIIWELKDSGDFEQSLKGGVSDDHLATSLHMAFVADRGMGKTTVAKLVGPMLRRLGLLENGHVVTLSLADIAASTHGAEEQAVREAFDKAHGGVLFFDEIDVVAAHRYRGQERSSVSQAINDMAEKMRLDMCLIVATYPDKIDFFLNSDQGLRSRFGNRIIRFPDYPAADLVTMLERLMNGAGFHLSGNDARSVLWDYFSDLRRNDANSFASGRTARNFAQDLQSTISARLKQDGISLRGKYAQASLATMSNEQAIITVRDIRNTIERLRNRKEEKVVNAFSEENPFLDQKPRNAPAQDSVIRYLPTAKPGAEIG